jgi:hypothetical protein
LIGADEDLGGDAFDFGRRRCHGCTNNTFFYVNGEVCGKERKK